MADGAEMIDQPRDFVPDVSDPLPLRAALGRFATGVTVVTCQSAEGPIGMTANSFSSVSLDPPLVLWSPARASRRFESFARARSFAIHVLAEGQLDLARRFTRGGAGFDGLVPATGALGLPVLPSALARFDCSFHAAHDGGDHLIIVGRVEQISLRTGEPLIFSQGLWGGFLPFGA